MMKNVRKDKAYLCDICELQYTDEPYVVINTHSSGDIKICSEPCFRVYLKEQEKMLSDLNVYVNNELRKFIKKLAGRADYELILELVRKKIDQLRYKMVENHYMQLLPKETKLSLAKAKT